MKKFLFCIVLLITLLTAACQPAVDQVNTSETDTDIEVEDGEEIKAETVLRVITHDSFMVSEDVIAAFEENHNIQVVFVKSGDTGSALSSAILTKNNPTADVFYGIDNTFLSRALEEGIFESYEARELSNVPEEFIFDKDHYVTPIDFGDVCINYDKAWFAENDLEIPQSLDDLLDPAYENLLVVENPAVSSPGLAFLFATISAYGEDGYLDYWLALQDNGLVIVNDWETAYYENFSASSGNGMQPMVLSYGSSPPVEVVYAEEELEDAPTASLVGENMCFRQIEFAGILKGTQNRGEAELFIEFLLSKAFQEDMPLQMFVFPVNQEAKLPDVFAMYAQIPEEPAALDADLIKENRDQWIQDWTDTILK